MRKYKDIVGKRFGNLVAIEMVGRVSPKDNHAAWLCQCDCGNTKVVSSGHLRAEGGITSCGCKNRGESQTRLYGIWSHMNGRCYKENDDAYKYYGGRGITVCQEWRDNFENFKDWAMANGYRDDLTLDRKDVNGNYCPENCKWATRKEQMLNTRRNHLISYNGETLTISEWAEKTGIKQNTLLFRIKRGWSVERALTTRV